MIWVELINNFWKKKEDDSGTPLNITLSNSYIELYPNLNQKKCNSGAGLSSPDNSNPGHLRIEHKRKMKDASSTDNASCHTNNSNTSFDKSELTDFDLIVILNRVIFLIFLSFIICLNIICLIILPYVKKVPLINDRVD